MRIGVMGGGNVGGTLGRRWAAAGHEVSFGVRHPEQGAAAIKGGGDLPSIARVVSVAEAARDADVVVLAVPWSAVPAVIAEAGELTGVTLIDATNPLQPSFQLDVGRGGESGAERVQKLAPRARVVKAFNSTGFNNMANPIYGGAPTVMFYAGDDAGAKAKTGQLVGELGFEAIDAGGLTRARELEHLAVLWNSLAFAGIGREFAFRLVRR